MAIAADTDIRHWSVDAGHDVEYLREDVHTLSLYLRGGLNNQRLGDNSRKGVEGNICLMAQGRDSHWRINQQVEFIHLYFTDALLKRFAAQTFESDTRLIELNDIVFADDEQLRNLITSCFSAHKNKAVLTPMAAEQSINDVMHYLLMNYGVGIRQCKSVKGGLSPFHIRQLRDYIFENISEKLSINSLANQVNLSPFHFSRMFKLSFGMSPADFVLTTRVEMVKRALKHETDLAKISSDTGFCHQSHMTQTFKRLTGYTPSNYHF